jgi:hypothetical protein
MGPDETQQGQCQNSTEQDDNWPARAPVLRIGFGRVVSIAVVPVIWQHACRALCYASEAGCAVALFCVGRWVSHCMITKLCHPLLNKIVHTQPVM